MANYLIRFNPLIKQIIVVFVFLAWSGNISIVESKELSVLNEPRYGSEREDNTGKIESQHSKNVKDAKFSPFLLYENRTAGISVSLVELDSTGVKVQVTFPVFHDYRYGNLPESSCFYVDVYGITSDIIVEKNVNIFPLSSVKIEQAPNRESAVLRIKFIMLFFYKPTVLATEGKLSINFTVPSDTGLSKITEIDTSVYLALRVSDSLTKLTLKSNTEINPTVAKRVSPPRVVLELPNITNTLAERVKVSSPHVKSITTSQVERVAGSLYASSARVVFYLNFQTDFSVNMGQNSIDILFGQIEKDEAKGQSGKEVKGQEGKGVREQREQEGQSAVETTLSDTASEEYVVGRGDVLEITLWQKDEEKSSTVTVQENGMITYSLVGDVMVDGLTTSQIDEKITEGLKDYLKDYEVAVVVKEYKSKMVYILGEVQSITGEKSGPGHYPLKGVTYLWDMIISAGGFTPRADLRKIKVTRETGEVLTVNLEQTLETGDRTNDILLKAGDFIYIPPTAASKGNNVFIVGDVKSTGPVVHTEELTVFDAVTMAGGLTGDTIKAKVDVIRQTGERLSVNFDYTSASRDKDVILQPGDVVHVKAKKPNQVSIFGEVKTGAGNYSLHEPTRLLDLIISTGGFTANADITKIRITHKNGEHYEYNLNKFIFEHDETQNPLLQPEDFVFVPSISSERNKIIVLGAVSKPGVYYAKEGITIMESVTQAGGVTDKANLRNARIIRNGSHNIVDLNAIIRKGDMTANVSLRPDDVVYIPRKSSSVLTDLMTDLTPLLQLGTFLRLLSR